MAKFRFEDLEIWKLAIEIGMKIFDIANKMESKLYRFIDQAHGVGMSMSNNIAESTVLIMLANKGNYCIMLKENVSKQSIFLSFSN